MRLGYVMILGILLLASCKKESIIEEPIIIDTNKTVTPITLISINKTFIDTTVIGQRQAIYAIHFELSQTPLDATETYEWKVIEKTTPDNTKWVYSICDLNACYPFNVSKGGFNFLNSTGAFIIDWKNYNSLEKDANDNYIEPLSIGTCSLKIIVYPKGGGDTITCVSKLNVIN